MAFMSNLIAPTSQQIGKTPPPEQDRMEVRAQPKDVSTYVNWGPQDVANHFTAKGYPEYAQLWISHKIDGKRAVLLTPEALKEMGIKVIGDRLGIQNELRQLKVVARQVQRDTVVAEHTEAYHGSWLKEKLHRTLCRCFPVEPDHYTLTSSTLKIREYEIARVCGVKCTCLGGKWHNDTIKLENIVDVDTTVTEKGCFVCAERKCYIHIANTAGNSAGSEESKVVLKNMYVNADVGDKFAKSIRQTIDENRTSIMGRADAA